MYQLHFHCVSANNVHFGKIPTKEFNEVGIELETDIGTLVWHDVLEKLGYRSGTHAELDNDVFSGRLDPFKHLHC